MGTRRSGQARDMDLAGLVARQRGVVARRQLHDLGIGWDAVDHHVRAGRWTVRTPRVVSTFTGEPTIEQLRWVGVLHAGPRSLLGGLTAAEHAGLRRWRREEVTVLVDDELSFEPVEGVDFFRSRRSFELLVDPQSAMPRCQLEPAILMWAGYDALPRAAHAVLASAVQQRLTTADSLLRWVDLLKPLRRAPAFRATLGDIAGGSQSGAELDVLRLCRGYRLREPDRQTPRLDRGGKRRWTDCEWDLPDGRTLVLEVDGSFHMEVEHWGDDKKRARRITTSRRTVIGCTAYELRHETGELATDLVALGVPRVPENAA
jgi:hypothetical protein